MANFVNYSIADNTLYTTGLTESGISSSVPMSVRQTGVIDLMGQFVAEPSYVNHMELTPTGDLHAYNLVDNPYAGTLSPWLHTISTKNSMSFGLSTHTTVDSYDSLIASYDFTAPGDKAIVSVYSSSGVFSLSGTKLRGYVGVGSYSAINRIGPNGGIGDNEWINGGATGIQPGHAVFTYFTDRYPATDPRSGSLVTPASMYSTKQIQPSGANLWPEWPMLPAPITVDGLEYWYNIDLPGYGSYNLTGDVTAGILISSSCNLRIAGNVNLTAFETIRVANGCSASIWLLGTVSLGGGLITDSANPNHMVIYGKTSTQTMRIGKGALDSIHARVWAGESNVTMSGQVDPTDFFGHIVARNFTQVGNWRYHFDENLRRV